MATIDCSKRLAFVKTVETVSVGVDLLERDHVSEWEVMLSLDIARARMHAFITPEQAREIAAKLNDFAMYAEQQYNPKNAALVSNPADRLHDELIGDSQDDPRGE
jgi:hypothetical protein